MKSWILFALISAITFALGDLMVVYISHNIDTVLLFIVYTILMGLVCFVYLLYNVAYLQNIQQFSQYQWIILSIITLLFIFAYLSHYKALTLAPNPGYANSLITLHVILLSVLSYYLLDKPINLYTMIGIIMMLSGGVLINIYSEAV